MKKQTNIGLFIFVTLLIAWPDMASAKSRFGAGLRGPVSIHASTNGGVGVNLPTPEITAGTNGVSTTLTPTGVQTNYTNSQGVSVGVSSDGSYQGAYQQDLPGNVTTTTGVSNGEVNSGVEVYVP